MLKVEIEVQECLNIIKEQHQKNYFYGTDQMEIDTDFLIEKGILEKKGSLYFLKDNYKDVVQREKILNNPIIKKMDKAYFILSPIIDKLKTFR